VKDFNIVIAHRGPTLGLWATIQSCEIELARTNATYSYLIVSNGDKIDRDFEIMMDFLNKTGKLGYMHHTDDVMSPPSARQLAAEHADGEILFFFDNHCLVAQDYFKRSLADYAHFGDRMDMLHSVTTFYAGDNLHYHYKLSLQKNFWASSSVVPQDNLRPYRIAAGGHGGFSVRRKVWEELGGYWNGFVGYGGEEIYFDLKAALFGKKNWIDPQVIHHHYAGVRGYARHYTDEYFRNMMMCANIIGGEEWMYKVYKNFSTNYIKLPTGQNMYDLLMEATEKSAAHAASIASVRHRTLDEQLILFREQNVAF
jgi:predicted glycosyltransferase involved in capsule biosynthesis